MRTVLIDNSLCVYALRDDVSAELVYDYIAALRDAGIRYAEVDFRVILKLNLNLPKGIGYIFRVMDPMFASLTNEIKFDYMLITTSDLEKGIKSDIPVMLECQTFDGAVAGRIAYAASRMLDGEITAVRLRSNFPMLGVKESCDWRIAARNATLLPIDVCPMNERGTALDTALKLTKENMDSLTLAMGTPNRYCSLEEYLFTLATVFDALPPNYSLSALCRASVYQNAIFRNGDTDAISRMLDILDRDMLFLTNVDTGARVNLKSMLRRRVNVKKEYVTALESLAKREKWSAEDYKMITDAIKRFGDGFYDTKLLNRGKHAGFLN